ncbi:MAG: PilZ domain-containing protein [Pseudomonadota bacterium]
MAAPHHHQSPAPEERRRNRRFAIAEMTSLEMTAGRQRYQCEIVDISLGGLGLLLDAKAPRSRKLEFYHPTAGRLSGRRIWSDHERIGVELQASASWLTRALYSVQLALCPDSKISNY